MLFGVGVKKHFGGVRAVDGCDFEIKENLITALIGPNGAGKSTVFNLISGLLKADDGKILFKIQDTRYNFQKNSKSQIPNPKTKNLKNGYVDITNLSPEKISNLGISRLFQQARLFNNLIVRDNLLLAIDNEDTKFWRSFFQPVPSKARDPMTHNKVDNILELTNLTKFKNTLARDLSYGQKRLVELGRTILNPHTFLMLDEPVAGINPKLRQKISKILLSLKKQGETILLIEHDMNFTLKISDWVIVMDEGKVIAQGTPDKIKNNPKVLEAYLGE